MSAPAKVVEEGLINYSDLEYHEELGHGGFGVVYKGSWQVVSVAIKELLPQKLTPESSAEFEKESRLMGKLKHPNIVQHYGYTLSPRYCIVMEYMKKGSLYTVLHSAEPLDWSVRIRIAKEIASGLSYLHSKNIIHRDIKSLNVLLNEHMGAKLTDFGLAKVKHESQSISTKRGAAGTLAWMAPELSFEESGCTKASDVYSLGITFWEIASRGRPFKEVANPVLIPTRVNQGYRDSIPNDCPPKFASLIKACWDTNPAKRPEAIEVARQLMSDEAFIPSVIAQESQSASVKSGYLGNLDSEDKIGYYNNQQSQGSAIVLAFERLKVNSPSPVQKTLSQHSEKETLSGNGETEYQLACMMYYGSPKNFVVAREWYEKAAEKGHVSAQLLLGYMYIVGEGVSKNLDLARQWYEKAATQGNAEAQNSLGAMYEKGQGVQKDWTLAYKWYEKAAAKGNTGAQYKLGRMYFYGEGVTQDLSCARQWWEKAAEKGHAKAQYKLGLMHFHGEGVTQDLSCARQWWEKAAEEGHAGAQYALGVIYEKGEGVLQNFAEARQWYEKAAAQGNTDAQYNLGLMYYNGNGVTQDFAQARQWYEKAAAKGNTGAQFNLGIMYSIGKGVTQDLSCARQWLEKAAEGGHAEAPAALEILSRIERPRPKG